MARNTAGRYTALQKVAWRSGWVQSSTSRFSVYTKVFTSLGTADVTFKAASADAARPTTELVLPVLSEHTMGQLMQMLMLATVVEGRLMNINPYGQPGVEAYKKNMNKILRGG